MSNTASQSTTNAPDSDPDDSWAVLNSPIEHDTPGKDTGFHLDDGTTIIWKAHPALSTRHDACLRFGVLDASGKPAVLQPYMGMMSHAAVMRCGRQGFCASASLRQPMAAQMFFDNKLSRENGTKLRRFRHAHAHGPKHADDDGRRA